MTRREGYLEIERGAAAAGLLVLTPWMELRSNRLENDAFEWVRVTISSDDKQTILIMAEDLPIVLYHYDGSPYARRLVWYLNLRRIQYSECVQPRIMPRPDVALLGVSYRRIPIMSIGRDVYVDTRLILQKLEALFPPTGEHPGISCAHTGLGAEGTTLEQLLSSRVIDGGIFFCGTLCLPPNIFGDPTFQRDRAALMGIDLDKPGSVSPFAPELRAKQRPEALATMRSWILWLEEGILSDGRPWITNAGNMGPSLADIEAVWVLHWVAAALPAEVLSPESAPKVDSWLKRFGQAVKDAGEKKPKVQALKGEEAAKVIFNANFAEPERDVLGSDPFAAAEGLQKGDTVSVWPSDYGFGHKDSGSLVSLGKSEYVVEKTGQLGTMRLHAPRHGYKMAKTRESATPKI
ncbi:glutathione S-transferase [Xylariaceae sp. FL1272]|nr:glutathione S-transferase [Xylariaceae sp. FL1272]